MVLSIIIGIVGFAMGSGLSYVIWDKALAKKKEKILKDAQNEADVILKQKELLAKEKFLQLKSDHEKYTNERNSKMAQMEAKIIQKDTLLSQKLEEVQRKKKEVDTLQVNLNNQAEALKKREEEVEKIHRQHLEKLEVISGLTAEEAKQQLVEMMKAEAKTAAMAYVNEIMEEAKLTATKESKKIVIQTIQRIAPEVAIENSVTVFPIENDEIKGRIIGREGRNIRALEAATGVEIIIDE